MKTTQDASKVHKSARVLEAPKSYKLVHAHETSKGPPQELLGALLEAKSSRIESKSNQNRSQIQAKIQPKSKSKSES